MLELAKKVIQLTESSSNIVYQELPQDDPKPRKPKIDRAKTILNWESTISLEQGLSKTIDYFRKTI
jgi:nucleoside-diphosphate-sugar epimerase